MFKPTTFRLATAIHWPGAGPTTEIAADNISKVESSGDNYTFVHASGHAVKVPKAEVTAYGVFDADDVPNLPTEEDYQDDASKVSDDDESTRIGGFSTPLPTEPIAPDESEDDIADTDTDAFSDKSPDDAYVGACGDVDPSGDSTEPSDDNSDTDSDTDSDESGIDGILAAEPKFVGKKTKKKKDKK